MANSISILPGKKDVPLKNRVVGSEVFSYDRTRTIWSQPVEPHREITLTITIIVSGRHSFWSIDTFEGNNRIPMSLHKYLYCESNPVMFIDPSGELSAWHVGVAITIGLFLYDVASGFQRFAWAREKIIKIKTEIEIGAYPIEYSMDTTAPHWRGFSVGMLSFYSTIGYEVTWVVIELDPPTVLVSYHSTSSSISKTFSYISKRIPTGG